MASGLFVQVDKEIFQLATLEERKCGLLVGYDLETAANAVYIFGLYSCTPTNNITIDNKTIWLPQITEDPIDQYYPAGCSVVGIWYHSNQTPPTMSTEGLNNLHQHLKDTYTYKPLEKMKVVVAISLTDLENGGYPQLTCYHSNGGRLVGVAKINEAMDYPVRNKLTFRLKIAVKLNVSLQKDASTVGVSDDDVHALHSLINNGVLWLPEHDIVISGTRDHTLSHKGSIAVQMLQGPPEGVSPLEVSLIPVGAVTRVPLLLDVVGVVHSSMGTSMVARLLKRHALKQLDNVINCLKTHHSTVGVYHYPLPTQSVPMNIIYPRETLLGGVAVTDHTLLDQRRELHAHFCLPLTVPRLRKTNLQWPPLAGKEGYLINPHSHLPLPPSLYDPDYLVAMVTGYYDYRHYMQDKFNDNGWGCAYRSLQTIWSWFLYQGYTRSPTPSHTHIQETLVDCGDKQKPFIGSKEWIGSFEVSTVLNHKLQIESRILQCPKGADMGSMGPVLVRHFQTQGTPVMIGGGVLAHTIIGVEYDRNRGMARFLILDPHYTGPDIVKQVLGKGCVWKGVDFWDQLASYNMCLPLRPQEI